MAVNWNDAAVRAAVRQAAMRGVLSAAARVHEEATSLIMEGPATGRVYRRGGVVHQASAPGEPPMSDTGHLAGSGAVRPAPTRLAARVNWSANYAAHLEFGTARMEPRPFARPALASTRAEVRGAVAAAIRRALG